VAQAFFYLDRVSLDKENPYFCNLNLQNLNFYAKFNLLDLRFMNYYKFIYFYKKRKYKNALRLLKKEYIKYPYDKDVILLFILTYIRIKSFRKAVFWLEYAIEIYDDPLFEQMYLFLLLKNKDRFYFLSKLNSSRINSFNSFLLSLYYYKNDNIYYSFKYSFLSIVKMRRELKNIPLYYKWFFIVLKRYRIRPKKSFSKYFLKILHLDYSDIYNTKKRLIERLEILKQNFIIDIRNFNNLLYNDLYQFWLYHKYKVVLYFPSKEVLFLCLNDLKDKETILKTDGNKGKKTDNILFKTFIFIMLIILLIFIFRKH